MRSVPPLLVAVLAGAACHLGSATAAEPPAAVPVSGWMIVREAPHPITYRASGTVHGRSTAVLTSKLTAPVRRVEVRAGDTVDKGQLLVVLDAAQQEAEVRRARAALDAAVQGRDEAESAREAAGTEARVARLTWQRAQNLYRERAMTRQELDETEAHEARARAASEGAATRVSRAAAQIAEARAQLAAAQAALADARLEAPFAGRVSERHIDPGSLAAPGVPLLVIDQGGALRVDAAVEESQAAHVHPGDPVEVTIGDAKPVEARVSEITPAVDPTSRSFIVKVALPEALSATLQPGMFARVTFRTGSAVGLSVPLSAVVPAGALDRVFVVEDGTARLRLVTLGERSGEQVEVLSGLEPGDKILTAPPPGLRDGQRIEVRP